MLSPLAPEEFFQRHWQHQELLIPRQDGDHYRSLFSFTDVDRILALAQRQSSRSVTVVPSPTEGQPQSTYSGDELPMHALYRSFNAGDTLKVFNLQDFWSPVSRLLPPLEKRLGARITANLYFTPPDSQGFAVHTDNEDVFVLQIAGSKNWFIYDPLDPAPVENLAYLQNQGRLSTPLLREEDLELRRQVELTAGDFLYIPRGFPHKAVAGQGASVHLTLGIHPLYWTDLLKAAVELAAMKDPQLREILTPDLLDQRVDPADEELFEQRLAAIARGSSLREAARAVALLHQKKDRFPPDGQFSVLCNLHELDAQTLIERRDGLECIVESDDQVAVIRFAGHQVRGPARLAVTFEFVRDTGRFRIQDLPGRLDEGSKVMLVKRMVKEGLLRPVQAPVAAGKPTTIRAEAVPAE